MNKTTIAATLMVSVVSLSGCAGGGGGGSQPVQTVQSAGQRVTLSTSTGKLSEGKNDLTVSFTDAAGNPMEVQAQSVRFFMPAMGTMAAMSAEASLQSTDKPGVYRGTVELPMDGTWQTTITYRDEAGPRRVAFNVRAR